MSLINGGDMPLSVRDHAYLIGETMMTVWFAKFGIPMDRLEEGMKLVHEQTDEDIKRVPVYKMAPSVINPVEKGYEYANNPVHSNGLFPEAGIRDFDAIVQATTLCVLIDIGAALETASLEEVLMQLTDKVDSDENLR